MQTTQTQTGPGRQDRSRQIRTDQSDQSGYDQISILIVVEAAPMALPLTHRPPGIPKCKLSSPSTLDSPGPRHYDLNHESDSIPPACWGSTARLDSREQIQG